MKALQTEISNLLHSYIAVVERHEPYFKSPFHYHPELELVYVKESHGKRIIGDKLDTFTDGDMVFMGSNLPHIWLNDEIYYKGFTYLHAQSIVVYFNKEVFSKNFYELKESSKINNGLIIAALILGFFQLLAAFVAMTRDSFFMRWWLGQ